jgi:Trk K+ transport system NAD-binding subunit
MSNSVSSKRVTFIVLRFMRKPILVLVSVYAISMVGWVLIPGVTVDGKSQELSFFHAFYFLTYTATTTGFGEIPITFSNAQRMWSIVSLYTGVLAWLYAVGSIVHLLQNPHFRQAVAERRFAKQVARIREPFVIVCGFGNTGSLLTRGLSDAGVTAVIVDSDPDRIMALGLRDYRMTIAGMCADARIPTVLIEAGLLRPNCRAVVALTPDEEVNLKISVMATLLNARVKVITQSTSAIYEETLATLGEDLHIIDPFQTFAKYLGAIIHNPAVRTLNDWLVGVHGSDLETLSQPPSGTWIVCGFGRMGHWIRESLDALEISTVVIEPELDEKMDDPTNFVVGRANQQSLRAAGIEQAAGIVAGTDNDAYNVSILLNAKALNPDIFLVVRQNHHRNEVLFNAAEADLVMQPTLVGARRILFLLTAPLLKAFFERMRKSQLNCDDDFIHHVLDDLRNNVGGTRPLLWTVDVCRETAPALVGLVDDGRSVSLGELLRDPVDRDKRLPCVPLVIESAGEVTVMPGMSTPVKPRDQILLCGTHRVPHLLDATLNNEYTLRYLISGVDETRSVALRWVLDMFLRSKAITGR